MPARRTRMVVFGGQCRQLLGILLFGVAPQDGLQLGGRFGHGRFSSARVIRMRRTWLNLPIERSQSRWSHSVPWIVHSAAASRKSEGGTAHATMLSVRAKRTEAAFSSPLAAARRARSSQ